MSVTPGTIAVTEGSGKILDTAQVTVNANVVQREVVTLGDGATPANYASVSAGGSLQVTDPTLDGCVTANVMAVSLPTGTVTTLTPPSASAIGSAVAAPSASAIGTAVSGDLLIGTQAAGSSVPVALPTATITTLTPPSAAAIAAAIVANPPTVPVTNAGTFAVQERPSSPTTANWSQAAINFTATGASVVVASVASQTVRIMRMFFVNSNATASTNITIQDTTPTNFSGAFLLQPGGQFVGAPCGEPLFITGSGKGFQLNSSAAVQISGTVWYTQS